MIMITCTLTILKLRCTVEESTDRKILDTKDDLLTS